MRSEFEHAGVWDLLRKKIAASEYTRPGDPLRIDVGYRPNGVVRMFHAVSLDPGLETAKVLAFSAAALRAGVERVEKAELELTAVIEPAARVGATEEEPERLELYRFGVETMEEHRIRVLTTSDMGRVAETARRELRRVKSWSEENGIGKGGPVMDLSSFFSASKGAFATRKNIFC